MSKAYRNVCRKRIVGFFAALCLCQDRNRNLKRILLDVSVGVEQTEDAHRGNALSGAGFADDADDARDAIACTTSAEDAATLPARFAIAAVSEASTDAPEKAPFSD